jgi:hypothetical protein
MKRKERSASPQIAAGGEVGKTLKKAKSPSGSDSDVSFYYVKLVI